MLTKDPVVVQRTNKRLFGLVDPETRKIYFPDRVDVIRGDVLGFRGVVRRLNVPVEPWFGAGVVAQFEEGEHFLPDLGKIVRGGSWTTDEDTGDRVYVEGTTVWTGPCHVESDPYAFDTRTDVGGQQVGSSVFQIQVPLEVVDIKDGDYFVTTTSRDPRLLVRTLTIKSARGNSDKLFREILAFDNQGD
jgi:hypothetical protein